jgi:1-deoxy-D-xylulose-5-phosphate synthase
MAAGHRLVVVVEDGVRVGGVGARLAQELADTGVPTPVHQVGVPCRFIDHASRAEVLAEIGLTAQQVARDVAEQVAGLADGTAARLASEAARTHDSST